MHVRSWTLRRILDHCPSKDSPQLLTSEILDVEKFCVVGSPNGNIVRARERQISTIDMGENAVDVK